MSQRFISESDIAANKKKLKEAWDATKGEDDPENPPELPPDNRTLFHRLEEQKLKKQDEYDDAHKLKNMVRGLEDDEVQFLDLVDRTKLEQEKRVRDEESSALSEFWKRRVEMEKAQSSEKVSNLSQNTPVVSKTLKTSQKSLLIGAIKRKSEPLEQENASKKRRTDTVEDAAEPVTSVIPNEVLEAPVQESGKSPPAVGPNGYLQCVGILPGLGNYSDSSDSEHTSSDSEPETRQIRVVHKHRNRSKNGGCC